MELLNEIREETLKDNELLEEIREEILANKENKSIDNDNIENEIGVKISTNITNVVSGEKLRKIQSKTLKETKDFLAKTFGPMGSNTKIIKGQSQADISSSYSKDGLKVLSNIINSGPIEASIVDELISITKAVEKEVGDGTTSTVILSSIIFDSLKELADKYNIPPFKLCRLFDEVVDDISDKILEHGRDCTLDDIYNISMISTNGNTEVSTNIRNIYETYGMDVDLSVGISNSEDSVVKVYDGLTITEGMSDPVFINNKTNNTSEIHDARIYHFVDPIDDMSQIALFEAILRKNIYEPYDKDESPIPTVITCPKLSRDLSAIMKQLANQLYQFDSSNAESAKPPILIITNVVASDEVIMDDIANLCGCKSIRKYIDPNVYKSDVEKGIAPTVDTIADFAGRAELVVADSKKTKFINPLHMSGDNNDAEYTAMLNFLETEIEQTKLKGETSGLGLLKKRLSALKSNMVDYLVGGITISDRDMKKDLIEDAIKNCKSASLYGVGYAANFEGLYNSFKVLNEYKKIDREDIYIDIASVIFKSYIEASEILYGTIELNNNIVIDNIFNSMINGHPYNISEGYFDLYEGENVLCSIRLDINILKDVSKIISTMLTANQCLLQASHLNVY
jgi:chaperonin GroEL (HSP60 family)